MIFINTMVLGTPFSYGTTIKLNGSNYDIWSWFFLLQVMKRIIYQKKMNTTNKTWKNPSWKMNHGWLTLRLGGILLAGLIVFLTWLDLHLPNMLHSQLSTSISLFSYLNKMGFLRGKIKIEYNSNYHTTISCSRYLRGHAILTSCYWINCLPTSALDNQILIQILFPESSLFQILPRDLTKAGPNLQLKPESVFSSVGVTND